jgi:hypothetical protein
MTLEFAEAAQTKDGLPRHAFAFTPSADPATWKLPYLTSSGAPDPAHLPGAAAALSEGGFRGERVSVPTAAIPVIKAKLRQAYKRWGKKPDEWPDSIRETDTHAEMYLDTITESLIVVDDEELDYAIAERMRFTEAGSDDHPYGAWAGGSKSAGGHAVSGGGGKDIPDIPTEAQRKAMGKEALAAHYAKVDKLPDAQRRAYYDAEANAAVSGKLKQDIIQSGPLKGRPTAESLMAKQAADRAATSPQARGAPTHYEQVNKGTTPRAKALDAAGVPKDSPLRYEKYDRNAPLPQSPKATAATAAKNSAAAERAGLQPGTATHTAYVQASATNQRAFSRGNTIKPENVKTKADRDLFIAQRRQQGTQRAKGIKSVNAKAASDRAAKDAAMARNTASRSNQSINRSAGQKGFALGNRGTGALSTRAAAEGRLITRLRRSGRSQSEIDAAVRVFRSNTR